MMEASETRELLVQLCRQFYGLGWVSGTGGGVAIRSGVCKVLACVGASCK